MKPKHETSAQRARLVMGVLTTPNHKITAEMKVAAIQQAIDDHVQAERDRIWQQIYTNWPSVNDPTSLVDYIKTVIFQETRTIQGEGRDANTDRK